MCCFYNVFDVIVIMYMCVLVFYGSNVCVLMCCVFDVNVKVYSMCSYGACIYVSKYIFRARMYD